MNTLAIPMTQLKAYSPSHFLIVLFFLLAAGLAACFLHRRKAPHTPVILCCGVFLLLSEILKQLLLTYVRGGSYSWSDLPFQLCSMPMYLCLLYPILPKLRRTAERFLMTYGLLGAIFAFGVPYSSFYHYLLLTVQSLLWHGILLFLALWLWSECPATEGKGEMRSAMLLYLLTALIAVGLNAGLQGVSGGTCNLFFLGPGYPDVFVLNEIYIRCGWITETAAMIGATELGAWLVFRIGLLKIRST